MLNKMRICVISFLKNLQHFNIILIFCLKNIDTIFDITYLQLTAANFLQGLYTHTYTYPHALHAAAIAATACGTRELVVNQSKMIRRTN